MESDGISQVIIIVVLIILSAYFSATETAFMEYNRFRMKNLYSTGNKKAEKVLKLDDDYYDRLMSTVVVCNNIAKISATAYAIYIFSKHYSEFGFFLPTTIMIVVILLFGEITPRSIAERVPEGTAMFASSFIKFFLIIFSPINFIVINMRKIIHLIIKTEYQPSMKEDELITMIDEVENEGVINKDESDLLRSAIEFNDTTVEEIFTPRIDIVGAELNDSMDKIKELFLISGYSRLPVYDDDIDHIIGVIHEKDFYQALNIKERELKNLISKVLYVTPNKKISELLRDLQLSKAHMAIVIDEYGGTAGLVTMEDIIEELVGEIWDEHDEVIEWFQKIGENKYLISCNANLEDFFDLLDLEYDDEFDVSTVNGWVTMLFEGIPEVGGQISYKNIDITITKAEVNRVLEISVEKVNREIDFTI